jgi:anti-sigma factor (TIGR02949 family)
MMATAIRSCEDALRLLAEHLDGELSDRLHNEVERHLSTCRSCFSRAEFEKRLKERIGSALREPASPELAGRVHALIRRFTVTPG